MVSKLRSLSSFLDELYSWFTCSPASLCITNIYQVRNDESSHPVVSAANNTGKFKTAGSTCN
jgi:hypothetical protein